MKSRKVSSKCTSHSSLICLICGDVARGWNFDVITCMSCKAFFRRNARRKSNELKCLLNNDCIITQQTRGGCSACRLKKCFDLGMKSDLIRSSPQKSQTQRTTSSICLPQPTTISLLSNDRSTLTFNEWNLLSNIIQAYDEQNLILQTQNALQNKLSLPLKLRSKFSVTFDIISSFYKFIQPFLERFPYFHNLSDDNRRILLQNNVYGAGSFNSLFVAGEAKIFDYNYYIETCNQIYGIDFMKEAEHFIARRELNMTLIKIMLVILAFSSNCSIIIHDHSFNLTNSSTTNSMTLIRIQNVFIIILWKYLVYQYGFNEAIRRLDNLVKCHLNILNQINEITNQQHTDMIDGTIQQITQSLTLEDQIS